MYNSRVTDIKGMPLGRIFRMRYRKGQRGTLDLAMRGDLAAIEELRGGVELEKLPHLPPRAHRLRMKWLKEHPQYLKIYEKRKEARRTNNR